MINMKQQGFSLIELIIFIIILGIISSSLLLGLNQAALYSDTQRNIVSASFLANARMQIILMNRNLNGYAALNDPCTVTPSLAICTVLSTYATNNSLTVATPIISGSNPKTIIVNVTGAASANITSQVYNYAND